MDRVTVYPGQLPLETDVLQGQQNAMIGIGKLAEACLGKGLVVGGFSLSATSVASLSLILSPGQLFQYGVIEASQWSSLSPDTRPLLRQGLTLNTTPVTFVPPTTGGYAQIALIQAAFSEVDIGQVVRPYYDAANPSVCFEGPGNDGQADNTVRQNTVTIGIKYGGAATAGQQVAPTPDVGYAGLYLVTLAAGATQITSANWTTYQPTPFIPVRIPEIPAAIQNSIWTSVQGAGSANALQASVNPPPANLVFGLRVSVRCPFTNTGNSTFTLNGLPTKAILGRDGTQLNAGDIVNGGFCDLMYNGSAWQLMSDRSTVATTFSIADNSLWHIGTPTSGTTVAMTTTLSPVPSGASAGLCMRVPITATNTKPVTGGQTTLDFGFGPKPIVLDSTGAGLSGGEMPGLSTGDGTLFTADFYYDGTNCRLMNQPFNAIFTQPGSALLLNPKVMQFQQQRAANTAAIRFSAGGPAGTFITRVLNVEATNQVNPGAALNTTTGYVTLPANAAYRVSAQAMHHGAGNSAIRIYNRSSNTEIVRSPSSDSHVSYPDIQSTNDTNCTIAATILNCRITVGSSPIQISLDHASFASIALGTMGDDNLTFANIDADLYILQEAGTQ